MNKSRVRLIPLGGTTDVTKNMYVYELYSENRLQDIIIVDCGIGFPREQQPGIDLVIPDITYLKDKLSYIRAILLTHGHEDHISALPYHYKDLGSPQVYASKLTAHFVQKKFEESANRVKVTIVNYQQIYRFGGFEAKFIPLTHSIPDPAHIVIKTKAGTFYHGADFKFDLSPPYGPPPDFYAIAKAGADGVTCLMSDCLGSEREGTTLSERVIGETFEEHIRRTKGKFIMTTFSSNISRIRQATEAAVKFGRKVCFLGRSMKQNTDVAKDIGYLPLQKKNQIQEHQIAKFPPSKICLVVAGSQGQFGSALSKVSMGRHQFVKISKGDKVLFSSDPIPGNEQRQSDVIESLILQGADVVYTSIEEQLHTSGHGNQEELKLLMRLVKSKYLFPIGGTVKHQRQYAKLARSMGYNDNQMYLLKDGQTLWFEGGRARIGETVPVKNVYVDAYGVGDVGNIILRDREKLGKEGVVTVALVVNGESKLVSGPDFLSNGFIHESEYKQIFGKAKGVIENILTPSKGKTFSKPNAEKRIISSLGKYFRDATGRRPLVSVYIAVV
ncbi:MAG: ribonuclease J [Candidatus Paceibacterota bacterium]